MAQHVLKYTKHGIYHIDLISTIYENLFKTLKIPKKKPFSVMDIGCGSGRVLFDVLYPLLPNNCEEIIATDIDESMINYCKGINTISKISFLTMNIEGDKIPETLEARFNMIFSSYCFMYVSNLRQALFNCKKMMKENGDLHLVFISKINPLHSVYAELDRIDAWKPYTKNFGNYVPHFSSPDPDSELNSLVKAVDLKLVSREFLDNNEFESEKLNFLEVFTSMDRISRTIPMEKREKYQRDFKLILSEVLGLNMKDKSNLEKTDRMKMNIPAVVLHMRK